MRLDVWLVKNWYFSSRNQAQEAILKGAILINWKKITKFGYKVKSTDKIEVLVEEKPRWYWKLKFIDENFQIFKKWKKYNILDLGTSRGGFFMYACDYANKILWIEISKIFEKQLKEVVKNCKLKAVADIYFEDIFKIDILKIKQFFDDKIDIILADLTLEPHISWQGVKRFIPILKKQGIIIWVHKGSKNLFTNFWENIKIVNKIKAIDRDEIYFYLIME